MTQPKEDTQGMETVRIRAFIDRLLSAHGHYKPMRAEDCLDCEDIKLVREAAVISRAQYDEMVAKVEQGERFGVALHEIEVARHGVRRMREIATAALNGSLR